MIFSKMLKEKQILSEKVEIQDKKEKQVDVNKTETPEDILRKHNFKIKNVIITSFGKQIDFAKKYEESEYINLLSKFKVKIKDKSIFIY
jgi:hypothetical protein